MLHWKEPVIYSAGKTWAAADFRMLRTLGFNINSRWIDLQECLTSPDDKFSPEIHADIEGLREVWDNGCKIDCVMADLGIVFATEADKNMHSGALVEIGHITCSDLYTGIRKPVYIIGDCDSFRPVANSDRAWKAQALVFHYPDLSLIRGFQTAVAHYITHFEEDYHKARYSSYLEGVKERTA